MGRVLMGPMLDHRAETVYVGTLVPSAGTYSIELLIDADGYVDESNENDNAFDNRRYRVKPYPDLRIASRQEGKRLHFTVTNRGDGLSGATTIKLKFKQSGIPSTLLWPGWRREGEYLVAPLIPVKAVGGGRTIEIDGPVFPPILKNGVIFFADINPNRTFQEWSYEINTATGIITVTSLLQTSNE